MRSLAAMAEAGACERLEHMLELVENVRALLALQVLWQRIMTKANLERSSLQKKLAANTKEYLTQLQKAAAGGQFTAVVFALTSLVYKAKLEEEAVDARVKATVKAWQQELAEGKLTAGENICALARCCNVKAVLKASEAVKKQRRQLNKQAVLAAWQEQLQGICDASTSKLVYREAGMLVGYLLAKN